MRTRNRLATRALRGLLAACPLVVACRASEPTAVPTDAVLRLEPSAVIDVEPFETGWLSAVWTDRAGRTLRTADVVWTTSDTTVAAVVNGVVSPLKPGTAPVTATAGGTSVSATVQVRWRADARLVFSADSLLSIGSTTQLRAYVRVPALGQPMPSGEWSSTEPGVATVSHQGLVTGIAPGRTTVSFTSMGLTAHMELRVVPGGTPGVRLRLRHATAGISPWPMGPSRCPRSAPTRTVGGRCGRSSTRIWRNGETPRRSTSDGSRLDFRFRPGLALHVVALDSTGRHQLLSQSRRHCGPLRELATVWPVRGGGNSPLVDSTATWSRSRRHWRWASPVDVSPRSESARGAHRNCSCRAVPGTTTSGLPPPRRVGACLSARAYSSRHRARRRMLSPAFAVRSSMTGSTRWASTPRRHAPTSRRHSRRLALTAPCPVVPSMPCG